MTIAEKLLNAGYTRPALIQKSLNHPGFSIRWNDGDFIKIAFKDHSYIAVVRKGK